MGSYTLLRPGLLLDGWLDDDSDTDSDNEMLMNSETNWARFLIVVSANEDLPLQ